jgi:hypothetical protein
VNSEQCILLHSVRYHNNKPILHARWLAVSVYDIYVYHRSLEVNFKLETVYSPLAANIPISVADPRTDCCSLHKQHNICVAIKWAQALCFVVAWNHSIRAKHISLILILLTWRIWWAPNNASRCYMGFNSAFKGLIHGGYFDVHHIPAYRPEG